jgi:hypothetical protein
MLRGMDDARLRRHVVSTLEERVAVYSRSAENQDERAASCADAEVAASRRQQAAVWRRCAAHYQQAIDLLKAAPMPPKDEPR